jgi:hypothetical protein
VFKTRENVPRMLAKLMEWCLVSVPLILLLNVHHIEAGNDRWTLEGGPWDSEDVDVTKKGLKVDEYVPANATVKLYPTNNGNKIQNADGSIPWMEYTNTGNQGFTQEYMWRLQKLNGLPVTDVIQETSWNPTGVLQAAAFSAGSMLPLAQWFYSQGYVSTPLTVPDFNRAEGTLYFGVSLNDWASENVTLSVSDAGTVYEILNGRVIERISGTGPSVGELEDIYFSNTPCVPNGSGGWNSFSPYSGEATLFGYHEFAAFDVSDIPTLTEWGLIIFGVVLLGFITWVFLRRRKAMSVRV